MADKDTAADVLAAWLDGTGWNTHSWGADTGAAAPAIGLTIYDDAGQMVGEVAYQLKAATVGVEAGEATTMHAHLDVWVVSGDISTACARACVEAWLRDQWAGVPDED